MASACNAQFTNDQFKVALRNSLQNFIHISGLKLEEKLCLETLALKRDVFALYRLVLRSLILQLIPRLLKDLWKLQRPCVLVVSIINNRPILFFALTLFLFLLTVW